MQAIETSYAGYRFRSRLEARWAVFYDACGITYKYEDQGVTLPDGNYLPDFWLPNQDCYIEIKGNEPTEQEERLAAQLADMTGKRVHIFFGDIPYPDSPDYDMYKDGSSYVFFPGTITFQDRHHVWNWHNGPKPDGFVNSTIEVSLHDLSPPVLTEMTKIDQRLLTFQKQTGVRAQIKVKHLRKHLTPEAWDYLATIIDVEACREWDYWFVSGGLDQPYVWGQCFECGGFSIGFSGWDERLACKGSCNVCMEIARHGYWRAFTGEIQLVCKRHDTPHDGCYHRGKQSSWAAPRLITAYHAARSARFEHGETPKVQRGKPSNTRKS
jgi:hypothetical protein